MSVVKYSYTILDFAMLELCQNNCIGDKPIGYYI